MNDAVRRTVKGGRAAFFENPESDRLLAMMMQFMSEHWVLKERVSVLEALLEQNGILPSDAVEQYQPSPEEEGKWGQQSFEFIQKVVQAAQNIDNRNRHPDP